MTNTPSQICGFTAGVCLLLFSFPVQIRLLSNRQHERAKSSTSMSDSFFLGTGISQRSPPRFAVFGNQSTKSRLSWPVASPDEGFNQVQMNFTVPSFSGIFSRPRLMFLGDGASWVRDWAYVRASENVSTVRILANRRIHTPCQTWCNFRDKRGLETSVVVKAECRFFKCHEGDTHWNFARRHRKACPYAIECAVSSDILTNVGFVALHFGSRGSTPTTAIPIRLSSATVGPRLAVCVSPTFNWTNPSAMATFFSYYLYAGASRFFLYKHSWSESVDSYLYDFSQRHPGVLVLVEWAFEFQQGGGFVGTDRVLHQSHLQELAMQHCLLEASAQRISWTVNVDFDEFVWMRRSNLTEGWLFSRLLTVREDICELRLRNSFIQTCDMFRKTGQSVLFRERKVHGMQSRSKTVTRPDLVLALFTHFVQECVPGARQVVAEPSDMVLLHQRSLARSETYVVPEPEFTSLLRHFQNSTCGFL